MLLGQYLRNSGIDLIREHRVKFSSFSNINDPFDFSFLISSPSVEEIKSIQNNILFQDRIFKAALAEGAYKEHEKGKFIENFKTNRSYIENYLPNVIRENQEKARRALNRIRLICFSNISDVSEEEDILLWSHYTNKHQGFRVIFDFVEDINKAVLKVEYDGPLTLLVSDILFNKEDFPKKAEKALNKKSSVWKYEHEMRMLVLDMPVEEEYAYFDPTHLKYVDLGLYCDPTLKNDIVDQLQQPQYGHVILRQAKKKDDKCGLQYEVLG